jgi:hypothetical protein
MAVTRYRWWSTRISWSLSYPLMGRHLGVWSSSSPITRHGGDGHGYETEPYHHTSSHNPVQ